MLKIVIAFSALYAASASCPNSCSGHGRCGASDLCSCYGNWQGADCSERVCPYDRSFVDTALNHEDAHNYAECSSRGTCNRKTGECECYDGYTGKACQRTVCSNDCSGHGTCEYIEDLAEDADVGGASGRHYIGSWDHFKTRGCKCDPHWEGNDCSSRKCPRGDDPLTTGVNEVQTLSISDDLSSSTLLGEFTITYQDVYGMKWTTRPIDVTAAEADLEADVEYALENLPNRVIRSVTVDVTNAYNSASGLSIAITFNAPSKLDTNLVVNAGSCRRPGCFPRSQGLRRSFSDDQSYSVTGGACTVAFTQDSGTYDCSTCLELSTPSRELANQGCCSLLFKGGTTPQFAFVSGASGDYPQSDLTWLAASTDTTNVQPSGTCTDTSAQPGGVIEVIVPASGNTAPTLTVTQSTAGTKEIAVCSNRGICDGSTGLCECFEGHTDEDCSIQTVLV